MNKTYGSFTNNKGEYKLTRIPESGSFEYIYKNKSLFLRVDQFGPVFAQHLPPAGMSVIKRKERETFSPWNVMLQIGNQVINNFDLYKAKSFEILYKPEKCIYHLCFSKVDIITTIMVLNNEPEIVMNVSLINKTDKELDIKILQNCTLEIVDSSMMAWDKREWYEKTSFDGGLNDPSFIVNHYSVNGNKKERNNVLVLFNGEYDSVETSYERLIYKTRNFSIVPDALNITSKNEVYAVEQTAAAVSKIKLNKELTFSSIIHVYDDNEIIKKSKIVEHFDKKYQENQEKEIKRTYENLLGVRSIKTSDENFNKFVNEFLPQEINWVIDLDRGWPTGMRGTRDCANDFMGYIPYNPKMCRELIKTLFSYQRKNDGWFPRQIPFGESNKFDLREFVDSGAFVIELVYEYVSFTNDFSIFEESFPYYQDETKETGAVHLIKAAKFYTLDENLGEHGLVKLKGGDWLDCLNKVGLKGRAETVMVTCQAILAFEQVKELLTDKKEQYKDEFALFDKYISSFKKNINKHALNEEGFYQAIFADDGRWYFSLKDIDGNKRVYTPTNAYAIIADVNTRKNKTIIKAIKENNKTNRGYRLFSKAFGDPSFEGLGKMSTGDFPFDALENGAIYNHGSQLFLIRALAKAGDYKTLYEVLNYALPYNQKFHPEKESCLPMYAITNCYNLIPGFEGRSAMCFLTGSISMIARAIYYWTFGVNFRPTALEISPCLPKEYKDSEVNFKYSDLNISIKYNGFGSKVRKIKLNDIDINGNLIDKKLLNKNTFIEVFLD